MGTLPTSASSTAKATEPRTASTSPPHDGPEHGPVVERRYMPPVDRRVGPRHDVAVVDVVHLQQAELRAARPKTRFVVDARTRAVPVPPRAAA